MAAWQGGSVRAKDSAVQAGRTMWGEMPPLAAYYYYAETHSSAGAAPRAIVYGRPPITWSSLRLDDAEAPPDSLFGDDDGVAGTTRLLEMRNGIRATAEKRQRRADARSKKSRVKRRRVFGSGLTAGCAVWRTGNRAAKRPSGHKLLPKWYGRGKVARLTSTHTKRKRQSGERR